MAKKNQKPKAKIDLSDTSFDDFHGLKCYRTSDRFGPKIGKIIKFEQINTGSCYPMTVQSCINCCNRLDLANDEWLELHVFYGKMMYIIDEGGNIRNGNGVYCPHHGE